jgi:hypothetical protein
MSKSRLASTPWIAIALTISVAAVLAYGFTALLGRYWAFYHLDTPGTGMGLLYIVLPGSFVVGIAVSMLTGRWSVRRGASTARAAVSGVCVAGLILVAVFVLEVWNSTAARSGEGEGAGDLAPFAKSLIGQ